MPQQLPASALAAQILGEMPSPDYLVERDVPIFAAHTIPGDVRMGPDGQPQLSADGTPLREPDFVVDARVLQYVARNCNRRYQRGEYAPIVVGHTIDGAPANQQPEVIGRIGERDQIPPFRLINKNGLPTIVCDFWIRAEDKIKRQKHPRVSVELWNEGPPENWFIDPVSVLGAVTPALVLGSRYSMVAVARTSRGARKYSAMLMPSATNVQIPGGKQTAKPKYEGAKMADVPGPAAGSGPGVGGAGALSDPDLQAIASLLIKGISATPEWQFVQQQMGAAGGVNGTPAAVSAGAPASPLDAPGGDAPAPGGLDAPGGSPPDPLEGADEYTRSRYAKLSQYMAEPDGKAKAAGFMEALDDDGRAELTKYACKNPAMKSHYEMSDAAPAAPVASPTQEPPPMANPSNGAYSASPAFVKKYEAERAADKKRIEYLEQQVGALAIEKAKVKRYDRLRSLIQDENLAIDDIDEEYALTAGFDDAQFDKHCENAVKKYARRPSAEGIWTGVEASVPSRPNPMEANAKLYAAARQIADSQPGLGWDGAKEAAAKKLAGG